MSSNHSISSLPSLTASTMFRWIEDDLLALLRTAPGFEAHLTLGGGLLLSGEPVADLNFACVDTSHQSVHVLTGFIEILERRGVELFYLGLSPAGKRLYHQCGFHVIAEPTLWLADGETSH